MAVDSLLRLALLLSIWLIVLSLGARASEDSALFVLRRPAMLARALCAMFLVAPAFAVLLAATTSVPAPVRFAIVAMSVGPVPPILPGKQMKAGGGAEARYAIGLMVAASLAAIVLTPLLVAAAARLLGAEAQVGVFQVARTLLLSIGLPLAAGMLLRAVWRRGAQTVGAFAQRAGGLLLIAVFAALVATAWREILELFGDGAMLAIAAAVAVGLLAGHLLGGERHRAALALAAASRHPGVALAIAEMSYPDQRKPIMAAILLYLLITALVTAPYVRWMGARASATAAAP